MIEWEAVDRRMDRLRRLEEGVAREVASVRNAPGVLLPHERRAYLNAMQDMIVNAEAARQALGARKDPGQ